MPCRRLIPEFAPQSGVMLTWPHPDSDWRDSLADIEPVYLQMARAISRYERVLVICYDDKHVLHVSALLAQGGVKSSAIRYVAAPTNDTWVRDYGPLSVAGSDKPQLLDYVFDGWGGKYDAIRDNQVTGLLFVAGVFTASGLVQHPLVLEGGAIDTDGLGTLLTTTRCLLESARNPGKDKAALQACFHEQLGIERTLWLDHGRLPGDDTDGHVDMLARFCTPHDIAYLQCTDPDDAYYEELAAMEQQLRGFIAHDGTPYTLHPLRMPRAICSDSGERLPASYANFLIINRAVLVPVYNDPADQQALDVVQQCFPDREIIAINCLPLIQQYGSLHCATMQLPQGVL
ncbi:MAG: agmatine deiminase family protein [Gammaproteobacteria bacterium]